MRTRRSNSHDIRHQLRTRQLQAMVDADLPSILEYAFRQTMARLARPMEHPPGEPYPLASTTNSDAPPPTPHH